MKIKSVFIQWVTITILLWSITGCGRDSETVAEETVRPVKTQLITMEENQRTYSFPGKISPKKEVILSFQVPGELSEFPILEGDQVISGTFLAKLDPENYQLQVEQDRAGFVLAEAQFKRGSKLVADGHISEADYDKLKSRNEITQSKLNRALKDLSDTQINAPFDGIIVKKYVENYEFVQAKQAIVELHDISHIDIETQVPASLVVDIKKGEHLKAVISIESLPDQTFQANFSEFSAQADPETQTHTVIYTMVQPEHLNILPGMPVTVKIVLSNSRAEGKDVAIVPSSAVFSDQQGEPSVWVVDPETMSLKKQVVKVFRLSDQNVSISAGLHAGERIVTGGVHFLRENQKVKLLAE